MIINAKLRKVFYLKMFPKTQNKVSENCSSLTRWILSKSTFNQARPSSQTSGTDLSFSWHYIIPCAFSLSAFFLFFFSASLLVWEVSNVSRYAIRDPSRRRRISRINWRERRFAIARTRRIPPGEKSQITSGARRWIERPTRFSSVRFFTVLLSLRGDPRYRSSEKTLGNGKKVERVRLTRYIGEKRNDEEEREIRRDFNAFDTLTIVAVICDRRLIFSGVSVIPDDCRISYSFKCL